MRIVLAILLSICATAAQGTDQAIFGSYSQAYLDRQQMKKWKSLCKGGGRYQAMAEAYDAGKPDPCNGAKVWQR